MYSEAAKIFTEGKAMFLLGNLDRAEVDLMKNMDQYGILPIPKYDTNQKNYVTNTSPDVAGIPLVVDDTEMSAIILEALTEESYKKVLPAYKDMTLQRRYTRDEESSDMIDIILSTTHCDFLYTINRILPELFTNVGTIPNYTSYWASIGSSSQKTLDNLYKAISTWDE